MKMPKNVSLNTLVTIQENVGTKGGYGHRVDDWSDIADVFVDIKTISAREKMRSGQDGASLTHTILTHYRADLDVPMQSGAWRIKYATRILNIISGYSPNGENRWLIFECMEGSVNGQ